VERDERQRANALDRYWDAVLRGETLAKPTDMDHEAAAVIARLGQHPVSPHQTRMQERVRTRISAQAKALEDSMHTMTFPQNALSPQALPGSVWSPARPASGRNAGRLRWAGLQLATALLVLVTVGFGYFTLGPGRSQIDQRAGLPAVVLPATPVSEATLDTVFATTLPAESIETAENLNTFILASALIDAGGRVPIQGQIPGPLITHVIDGELTLRVDGPLQVFRASDSASSPADAANAEEVPPGEETVLEPGDTVVYSYQQPAEYANFGSKPVHIILGGFLAGVLPGAMADLDFVDYAEKYPTPALPHGSVQATLIRAMLPPDGSTPASPPDALSLSVGAVGEVSLGESSDGAVRNINPDPVTIYVLRLESTQTASGTPTT